MARDSKTYQQVYPSSPLLRSDSHVRSSAAELLTLEFFEAPPASMPTQVFDQHHVLINLKDEPTRVENWRGDTHREFLFRRNEIVVTPAGLKSGWRWHEISKVVVITLLPDRFAQFAQTEVGVILSPRQLIDLEQFEDGDITQAAEMLLDALAMEGRPSDVLFESLARVFLVKLVQRYGETRTDEAFSSAYTARHHRRVLDLIENRYADSLSVEELASAANLSAAHFSRVFKSVIGEPPHRFLMRYRVECAAKLMGDANRSMLDVALSCGFSDQPHFTRVFKQFRGQTPKQWRRSGAD